MHARQPRFILWPFFRFPFHLGFLFFFFFCKYESKFPTNGGGGGGLTKEKLMTFFTHENFFCHIVYPSYHVDLNQGVYTMVNVTQRSPRRRLLPRLQCKVTHEVATAQNVHPTPEWATKE